MNNNTEAAIKIGDEELKLKPGEWSEWVPVEFELIPWFSDLHGMVRIYLRSINPHLEMYISPINFDPENPDTILSAPNDFAEDLADETGRFYTQGMPEETKALEEGILTKEEFFQQASISAKDILAQLDYVVEETLNERRSFLFYYLGHLDQISHMTWKSTDPEHPTYDPETDPYWAQKIEELYIEIDTLVGQLRQKLGDKSELIVMSDHGFAPWRRELDLNAWLVQNGYMKLKNQQKTSGELFENVDWSQTQAYGLGFNGLYIYQKGREVNGTVEAEEKKALLDEIKAQLLNLKDPKNNSSAVTKVYLTQDFFDVIKDKEKAPDLLIGYAYGYRNSSDSALGAVGPEIFKDHTEAWSGDHSMDHEAVPGILLTSKKLNREAKELKDLSRSILAEYDILQ